jgi:hypothetical protein
MKENGKGFFELPLFVLSTFDSQPEFAQQKEKSFMEPK